MKHFSNEFLRKTVSDGLQKLLDEGMPSSCIKRMLASARPLGDLAPIQANMTQEEIDEFFTETRKHGVDGSVDIAFGGSDAGVINDMNKYSTKVDLYHKLRGEPYKEFSGNDLILYAGHQIEPVFRNYVRKLFSERYIVFDCDIQFNSKKYPHCIVNVDGLLYDKQTGQFGILEIKTVDPRSTFAIYNRWLEGRAPESYDMQGRVYMEALDADFVLYYAGWGIRPLLDDQCAKVRIERDLQIGELVMSKCERFITEKVIPGVAPDLFDITNPDQRREAIESIYGPVDYELPPVKFSDDLDDSIRELLRLKDEYDAAQKEAKKVQEVADAKKYEYEQAQFPFLEALEQAPYGTIDVDGKHCTLYYKGRKAVAVDELKTSYPSIFNEVRKDNIDTAEFKKKYPDLYKEFFKPIPDGKRSFSINIREAK